MTVLRDGSSTLDSLLFDNEEIPVAMGISEIVTGSGYLVYGSQTLTKWPCTLGTAPWPPGSVHASLTFEPIETEPERASQW